MARNPKRAARIAQLQVRAIRVTLEVPQHLTNQSQLHPVELNALLVEKVVNRFVGGC
ncbi:MAG: hypothetical protein ACFB0C_17610 [Leptolyngbyaceae cyanobacterium]